MSFHDVAINDGCMAGSKLFRNFIESLDCRDICRLRYLYDKSAGFQMLNPTTAAASARGHVDLDDSGLASLICLWLGDKGHRQTDRQRGY